MEYKDQQSRFNNQNNELMSFDPEYWNLSNSEFNPHILSYHVENSINTARIDFIAEHLNFICKYCEQFPINSIQLLNDLYFYSHLLEKLNQNNSPLLNIILKTFSTIISLFSIDQAIDICNDNFVLQIIEIADNSETDTIVLTECILIFTLLVSKSPLYSHIFLANDIITKIIKIANDTSSFIEIVNSENIQINDELQFSKWHARYNELKELEKEENLEEAENKLRQMIGFCIRYSTSHNMHIEPISNQLHMIDEPIEEEQSFRNSLFNSSTETNELEGYRMSYDDSLSVNPSAKPVFNFFQINPTPVDHVVLEKPINDLPNQVEQENSLIDDYNFACNATLIFSDDPGFLQYRECRSEMMRLKKQYDVTLSHNNEKMYLDKLLDIESKMKLRTKVFGLLSAFFDFESEDLLQYLDTGRIMPFLRANFYVGQQEGILGFILNIWTVVCKCFFEDFIALFNDQEFVESFCQIAKIDNEIIIHKSLDLILFILDKNPTFFTFELLSEIIQKSLIFTNSTKKPFAIIGLDILQKFFITINIETILSTKCLISNICHMCQNSVYHCTYKAFHTLYMIMELCENASFMSLIMEYPIIDPCIHLLYEEDRSIIRMVLRIFNRILFLSDENHYYKFIDEALFQKWDVENIVSFVDDDNEEICQLSSSLLEKYKQYASQ